LQKAGRQVARAQVAKLVDATDNIIVTYSACIVNNFIEEVRM